MKLSLRSVATGVLTLAVATGGLLLGGGVAAAVTPGWEPDPAARGSITFYDASGAVITGGSTTAGPFAAYAAASGPGRTGDTKATLFAATPVFPLAPAQWSASDFLTASTNYPNAGAPAPVNGLTDPVATGQAGDLSLADYIAANPNTSTDPNWQNLYQIRLVTSGTSGADSRYYRTVIRVTGNTWSVEFPLKRTLGTATHDPYKGLPVLASVNPATPPTADISPTTHPTSAN